MEFKFDVKVDIKKLRAVFSNMEKLGALRVQVGVVGEAATRPTDDGKLTQGENAVYQEVGTLDGHIPGRHFVGDAVRRHRRDVAALLRKVVASSVGPGAGESAGVAAADAFGRAVAEIVKNFILDSEVRPLNAPATRQMKGPLPALVDSMSLVEAIGHRVVRASGAVLESGADSGSYEGYEYGEGDE